MDYISGNRQVGCAVSAEICQLKALALEKEMEIKNFKASCGWVIRFFAR
jgi:hypothetical protein